jgi:hypothetical protein
MRAKVFRHRQLRGDFDNLDALKGCLVLLHDGENACYRKDILEAKDVEELHQICINSDVCRVSIFER